MTPEEEALELERAKAWQAQEAARARHRAVTAPTQLRGDAGDRRALEDRYAARKPSEDNLLTPNAGPGPAAPNPRELEPGGGTP